MQAGRSGKRTETFQEIRAFYTLNGWKSDPHSDFHILYTTRKCDSNRKIGFQNLTKELEEAALFLYSHRFAVIVACRRAFFRRICYDRDEDLCDSLCIE